MGNTSSVMISMDADAVPAKKEIAALEKQIKKLENKETRKKMRNDCIEMAKIFDISKSEQQRKKIYEELLKGVSGCE